MGHLLRPVEGGADTGTELNNLSVGTQPEEQMAWGPLEGKGADRGQACRLPPAKSQRPLFLAEKAPNSHVLQ